VPDSLADFSFTVQAPFGTDHLWAFAVGRAIGKLPGQTLENGPILMSQNIDQIRQVIKMRADQWFDESSKPIETRANKP
jgi:hypothetical protein